MIFILSQVLSTRRTSNLSWCIGGAENKAGRPPWFLGQKIPFRRQAKFMEPSYRTIPKLGQVLILALCRGIEPIAYSSVTPYLYFMIRDMGYNDPATISSLSVVTLATFALGQATSGVLWGKCADIFGRKISLLVGVVGVLCCTILFGFSTSVQMAITVRFLAGFLNGNVALVRTMVGEITASHKSHQSHAFTILPIAMNIGTVCGPILTGMLANPVENIPWLRCRLFAEFPYLLPNLVPAPLLLTAIICILLFVQETRKGERVLMPVDKDWGLKVGDRVKVWWNHGYEPVYDEPTESGPVEAQTASQEGLSGPVVLILLCYTLLFTHCSFYLQLLPIFLSTPRMDDSHTGLIRFNGGAGLDSRQVGTVLSLVGIPAVIFQLVVYPRAAKRYGSAGIHRMALYAFLAYILIPYLAYLHEPTVIMAVAALLAIGPSFGTSFGLLSLEVLMTNYSNSQNLGLVNGVSQVCSSIARTIGPLVLGNTFAAGIRIGIVGLSWWIMGCVIVIEIILGRMLPE